MSKPVVGADPGVSSSPCYLRNHGRPTFHRSGGGACAERAGEHDRNDERHGCDLTGYEGTPSRCRDARASGGKAQLHEAHEDGHPPPLRKPLEHAPSAAQQQMGDRLDEEQPETRSTSDHGAQQTATADCGETAGSLSPPALIAVSITRIVLPTSPLASLYVCSVEFAGKTQFSPWTSQRSHW